LYLFCLQSVYQAPAKGIVLVNPDERRSYSYNLDKEYNKVIPSGGGGVQKDGKHGGSIAYESVDKKVKLPPISGLVLINR